MRKKLLIIAGSVVVVIIVTGAVLAINRQRMFEAILPFVTDTIVPGKFNSTLSPGRKAPTFVDIPAVVNGQDTSVSLDKIKEDVVVVAFLGNHCPIVQMYEDRLVEFTDDYKDKNVKVVGIAVADIDDDKLPAIKTYTKEHNAQYVYGYDASQATAKAYGATKTPEFFVLDKERYVRYMGALDDNLNETKVTRTFLRSAVDAVLKGQSPEVTETLAVGCGIPFNERH